MGTSNLLESTEAGLYCREGDFFIDPWRPVDRAVVTHAHADHACRGCGHYLTSRDGANVLRVRMGPDAVIAAAGYGETVTINGVSVSLHPAGHILGSSQVRVEQGGYVWVVSGDYKVEPDATCAAFEPVRCHAFVSESTFGLPIYRWPAQSLVFESIRAWWRSNQEAGRASVLLAYSLGKAQRLIAGVGADLGPIFTHGAVEPLNRAYRASGVPLPETAYAGAAKGVDWSRALIVAPPSAQGTPWMRRFGAVSTGFTSGWMRIRGARRRRVRPVRSRRLARPGRGDRRDRGGAGLADARLHRRRRPLAPRPRARGRRHRHPLRGRARRRPRRDGRRKSLCRGGIGPPDSHPSACLLIAAGFLREDALDVACPMQNPDDHDAVDGGLIENQVGLEARDPPDTQPGEAWVGRLPPLTDAGHPGDLLESRMTGVVESQGRFQACLLGQIVGLIVQIPVGGG